MKTYNEFKEEIGFAALAVKAKLRTINDYAKMVSSDTQKSWQLVQIVRFADKDLFDAVWSYFQQHGDECAPDDLMKSLAHAIVETALNEHPILCHE